MQLFYQFQYSLVPDRNCWLLNSSLPNLLVIMSCLTESSNKDRWTWFWHISARNLPYLTPVLLVLLFWNDLIVTTFMISFWNLYPHLTYRNCYKYQWMDLVFTGMYPKFIPVTEENEFSRLINIGSCVLHVLQSAMRTGLLEIDWEINKVLHAMRRLFDVSPARRYTYIRETWLWYFSFAFLQDQMGWGWTCCCTRNSDMGEYCPGCEVLAFIVKRQTLHNKSFHTLVQYHTDKLMISELHFLKYIASILRPFLLWFQTRKPMIPLLAIELNITLRQLISLVAKGTVFSDGNTPYLIVQLHLGRNGNLSNIDNVELDSSVMSPLANLKV